MQVMHISLYRFHRIASPPYQATNPARLTTSPIRSWLGRILGCKPTAHHKPYFLDGTFKSLRGFPALVSSSEEKWSSLPSTGSKPELLGSSPLSKPFRMTAFR